MRPENAEAIRRGLAAGHQERVVDALDRIGFAGDTEAELCGEVDAALVRARIKPQREVTIGEGCRIDRLWRGVGIEVKAGSPNVAATTEQLRRYAETGEVDSLILVTERSIPLPDEIAGVPVRVVNVHHGPLAL